MIRRITLIGGGVLIAWGLLGVLDALGLIHVSICGLLWACLIIAVGVWLVWGAFAKEPVSAEEDVAIPLQGATEARISISHGAGRLQIGGGAGSDQLAAGRFAGGVTYDVRREGTLANVDMRVAGQGLLVTLLPWKWPRARGAEWNLALNEGVPLTLKIQGGASDNRLDLTSLQVKDLLLETGASATKLTLPAGAGETHADVSCGAGGVEIRIPSGVAARIHARSTMAETKIDRTRFPRVSSGLYESPDYETATNKVELRAETSLGSLDIR
jgi:hypothetical protein